MKVKVGEIYQDGEIGHVVVAIVDDQHSLTVAVDRYGDSIAKPVIRRVADWLLSLDKVPNSYQKDTVLLLARALCHKS